MFWQKQYGGQPGAQGPSEIQNTYDSFDNDNNIIKYVTIMNNKWRTYIQLQMEDEKNSVFNEIISVFDKLALSLSRTILEATFGNMQLFCDSIILRLNMQIDLIDKNEATYGTDIIRFMSDIEGGKLYLRAISNLILRHGFLEYSIESHLSSLIVFFLYVYAKLPAALDDFEQKMREEMCDDLMELIRVVFSHPHSLQNLILESAPHLPYQSSSLHLLLQIPLQIDNVHGDIFVKLSISALEQLFGIFEKQDQQLEQDEDDGFDKVNSVFGVCVYDSVKGRSAVTVNIKEKEEQKKSGDGKQRKKQMKSSNFIQIDPYGFYSQMQADGYKVYTTAPTSSQQDDIKRRSSSTLTNQGSIEYERIRLGSQDKQNIAEFAKRRWSIVPSNSSCDVSANTCAYALSTPKPQPLTQVRLIQQKNSDQQHQRNNTLGASLIAGTHAFYILHVLYADSNTTFRLRYSINAQYAISLW
ncbi:MAG: hypothetical protein EZS28_000395 [Streblomastix strix]|uniref:Uncharacterized protein n=1 Tax=Streblomastix strix TaxID=222440 RepID=A0A5J4XB90_9EUKA|nr:MAG: hypothetical protein EZS28_000395 [Streblomastix strix]